MKPEYRFEFSIVDKSTDEVIEQGSTFILVYDDNSVAIDEYGQCESVDQEVAKYLRIFRNSSRDKYEEENYPTEQQLKDRDD